jgi:hypothetical protein
VPATLTPFSPPLSLNISPRRQTLGTKPAPTTVSPTTQPDTGDQLNTSQAPSSAGLGANPEERDTLVEAVQQMQERLVVLEGQLSGERAQDHSQQRLRRTSSGRSSDAPPTYISNE